MSLYNKIGNFLVLQDIIGTNISSILKNNFEKMLIGAHSLNEGHLEKPQIILVVYDKCHKFMASLSVKL